MPWLIVHCHIIGFNECLWWIIFIISLFDLLLFLNILSVSLSLSFSLASNRCFWQNQWQLRKKNKIRHSVLSANIHFLISLAQVVFSDYMIIIGLEVMNVERLNCLGLFKSIKSKLKLTLINCNCMVSLHIFFLKSFVCHSCYEFKDFQIWDWSLLESPMCAKFQSFHSCVISRLKNCPADCVPMCVCVWMCNNPNLMNEFTLTI